MGRAAHRSRSRSIRVFGFRIRPVAEKPSEPLQNFA
jgi:hypothetical protein